MHKRIISQLFVIGDTREENVDEIAERTLCWLCFNNNLHEHWDDNVIVPDDVKQLTQNVSSAWRRCHNSKHRRLSPNCTEIELCEAGCDTVDEMRKERFSLAETPLEQFLSEGCIYYYSNSPTNIIPELPLIGWHRDWEDKFKKS